MSGGWVAAAIAAAVAAGSTYYNNTQVAKKQDNELANQLRQQEQLQNQANTKTKALIQDTAKSSPTQAKASLLQQYQQQLAASQSQADNPLTQAGKVSDAYTKSAQNAALGISNFGNTNAGLLSSIDAPGMQRQQEAENVLQYQSGIGQLEQQSKADQFLSQMRLRNIRPNPWISALGSAAQSYASSGGGGGGGGTVDDSTGVSNMDMGGGLTASMPTWGNG